MKYNIQRLPLVAQAVTPPRVTQDTPITKRKCTVWYQHVNQTTIIKTMCHLLINISHPHVFQCNILPYFGIVPFAWFHIFPMKMLTKTLGIIRQKPGQDPEPANTMCYASTTAQHQQIYKSIIVRIQDTCSYPCRQNPSVEVPWDPSSEKEIDSWNLHTLVLCPWHNLSPRHSR